MELILAGLARCKAFQEPPNNSGPNDAANSNHLWISRLEFAVKRCSVGIDCAESEGIVVHGADVPPASGLGIIFLGDGGDRWSTIPGMFPLHNCWMEFAKNERVSQEIAFIETLSK